MAGNEDENQAVMQAVLRDARRPILWRRVMLAMQLVLVLGLIAVLLGQLFQILYQNNEIPFLRHPVYVYLAPYFGATPPNPGATFSAVWQPSPAGSSDINTPITFQLALYGPLTGESASAPFIPGEHKPIALSPTIHTSSWENQTYAAHLNVPPHLVPGDYLFIALSQNGALGSSSVPDEVFLPCQQFIFSQGYPGDFFCLKH